jgi:hypothetical protein
MTEIDINFCGEDEYPSHMRVLIVGQPGVGKTTLAAQFPNPLWINAACGITTLARIGGIPYVDFTCEMDLFNVKQLVDSGDAENLIGRPIETIVIDSVDEMQRLLLIERLNNERRAETKLDDWGWLNARMHAIFGGLSQLPVNLVVIAHTKDVNVGDEVIFKPALGGQFCEHIHEYVDMSLWMHANTLIPSEETDSENISVERWLLTTPHYEAEWVNDKTGCLPEILPIEDDFFSVIKELFSGVSLEKSSSIKVQVAEEEPVQEEQVEKSPTKAVKKEVVVESKSQDSDDICSDCGKNVEAKTWSDLSKMRFNTVLCSACFKGKD